jgi:glutamate dehydrogenase
VVAVAADTGRSVEDVVRGFHRLGQELRIAWLRAELDALPAPTRTQRWAVHAVREDTLDTWRELARHALAESPGVPAEEAVGAFLERRGAQCRRVAAVTRSLAVDGGADLSALMLAVRQLRTLAE